MDIGIKIQQYRINHNLSQESLAEHLGVSRQSVSKWELGQTIPEIDKIIAMSYLFSTTTDELLLTKQEHYMKPNKQQLHLGTIYLIVKDFQKSIDFYEKLLSMRVSFVNPNIFATFDSNYHNIAIMNETNIPNHDYTGSGDNKFTLNFWIANLRIEYDRVKSLNIGEVSEIMEAPSCPGYYFFNVIDPDYNVIEITGDYAKNSEEVNNLPTQNTPECQSCAMRMDVPEKFGSEKDNSINKDYCCHCYQNGAFTNNLSFEEAVENNIPWWKQDGDKAKKKLEIEL